MSSFWHSLGSTGVSRCSHRPQLPPGAATGCVLLMGFPWMPSALPPPGPASPSEKNLPANTGQGRGEQQELFPPNCLQDSFGTMSTVRPSTRYTQWHHLKKLKTFSVGSYITDQQFTKFLHEENKCFPVFLPLISSLDRNPRDHILELVESWLLSTCVGCL